MTYVCMANIAMACVVMAYIAMIHMIMIYIATTAAGQGKHIESTNNCCTAYS